ncbi:DUF4173 domain-containing protein [Defluviimonas sp. WL0050]|uniref:DUF4173 domain-containing protein n=1 Tax=Albidovulum litorale TaxID=2984134 RepID=A0ABT2ZIF8_9RHOB|nr:DUF4173 domain-containing protein [Defluviimonas sp. WL0050]MCV2870914.1 DUF4173 domain-containing protein [Defluviimonas sp. WL0050]
MPELELRGVPRSLQRDAWWLAAIDEGEAPAPNARRHSEPRADAGHRRIVWPVLLALVTFADWLFWGHAAGLSLPLFAAACLLAILGLSPHPAPARELARLGGAFLLVALPVAESVQALSLLFLIGGSLAIAARLMLGDRATLPDLPALTGRLALLLPGASLREAAEIATSSTTRPRWHTLARDWTLPLVAGLIFITLLIAANPVAERWGVESGDWLVETLLGSTRPLFWALIAMPLWPLLRRNRLCAGLEQPFRRSSRSAIPLSTEGRALFHPASVTRSLILFNLIFAAQSVMDLTYLWSGAALPDGMTYAEYAHRGAYPLVATALLAGAFALACRRFAADHRILRALLLLWIGQNVLLVVSSLYRLDLYVGSYGLTYLRAYAAIWMALVAAGLITVVWQIVRARSNGWLVGINAGLLAATLYASAFVNFAHLIAAYNLGQKTDAIDYYYICDLGPDAAAALRAADPQAATGHCSGYPIAEGPQIAGWRDWGFRSWRIRRYLAATEMADPGPDAGENPRY